MVNRRSRAAFAIGLAGIFVAALAFRAFRLECRPMHGDEANQACKTGELQETLVYRYDPMDHHGPAFYYFSLPSVLLSSGRDFSSTTEWSLRIVPVLFGSALVLLLYLLGDGMGRTARMCAAIFLSVSPAMVFYSRFYIHEMLLVFFTFGAIVCGWRYFVTRKAAWALLAGAALGLMHATKETCIFAYGAMFLAAVAVWLWEKRTAGSDGSGSRFDRRHLAGAAACGLAVSFLLFSSFLANPAGLVDSLRSYYFYLFKAVGDANHIHPFYFYLKILAFSKWGNGPVWSEGLVIVLAVTGAVAAVRGRGMDRRKRVFLRFITIYTLLLTLAYSVTPYKTPWCMISFLQGMVLMAGAGAAVLIRAAGSAPRRAVVCLLLASGAAHLGWQAYRAGHDRRFYADPSNPYVYAHTSPDLLKLIERMEDLAAVHPRHRGMLIRVAASPFDTWPIPFYLRGYENVGYWHREADLPDDMDASVIIASPAMEDAVAGRLSREYQSEYFGLRPEVLLKTSTEKGLWDAFIETRR